ncbi:hypothetical protein OSB04_un001870 [Centaurea solstitialis]|uniref:Uncharacterized protein n=1 Tax=Centaurea solstitialis TaxID=347529 RepID=A0AA38S3M0_9ASTR|nr:hypothetical protein OSB04_un001870 [Centaurea solstitialis]
MGEKKEVFIEEAFHQNRTNAIQKNELGFRKDEYAKGKQFKQPTLIGEEYPEWKVRMINFLEGIHPRISEFLYNPPYVSMDLIPRVPTTGTTPEISEHYEPKSIAN